MQSLLWHAILNLCFPAISPRPPLSLAPLSSHFLWAQQSAQAQQFNNSSRITDFDFSAAQWLPTRAGLVCLTHPKVSELSAGLSPPAPGTIFMEVSFQEMSFLQADKIQVVITNLPWAEVFFQLTEHWNRTSVPSEQLGDTCGL